MTLLFTCVPECTSDSRRDPCISFHRFPSDVVRRKAWLSKIRRDVNLNTKNESLSFKVFINYFDTHNITLHVYVAIV
mgnify:CR=1 FL=1